MAKESKKELLFKSPRSRVVASTLGVFLASLLVTSGMPLYLPFSQADNLGLPIIAFPVIWLCLFLTVLFIQKIWKAWILLLGLSAIHMLLIYNALSS